jgi:nucleotide-binding universal stress UspA family protein
MNITLYGKRSSLFKHMKAIAIRTAQYANVTLNIKETTDTNEILGTDIQSIPAYQLNEKISSKGDMEIDQFIKQMQISILRETGFGKLRPIIVPVDFSETSEKAALFAIHIAKKVGAAIHLIHAYHTSPQDLENGVIDRTSLDHRKEKLNSFTTKMNSISLSGNEPFIDSYLEHGLTGDTILKASQDINKAWIIMGSNKKANRLRSMFGSISTKVALESTCPVFLVPPAHDFQPFNRIAFCLSDQSIEEDTIKQVCSLAELFNSDLFLLHASSSGNDNISHKVVTLIASYYPKNKITYQHLNSSSDHPVEVIRNFSEANSIDLLVIRKSSGGLFYDIFHKSFTKKMSLSSKLPLFILPSHI